MKPIISVMALAVGCASLGACATVTRGSSTAWEVKTSPPGASVKTSNGLTCASTPCSMQVSRKSTFTATVSKPGYQPVDVAVSHDISPGGAIAFAGNALIGGLIGMTIDLVTGAFNDITPANIELNLEQSGFAGAVGAGSYFAPSARAWAPIAQPAPQVGSSSEGRITTLRVQSDGSVQETRERAN